MQNFTQKEMVLGQEKSKNKHMTENSYYAKLTKFYRARAIAQARSNTWEAKFTRTNTISFKALKPHQELSMLEAERAYGYKIPDASRAQKPFDGMTVYDAAAYFIAIYFKDKKSTIYEIELRKYIEFKQYSRAKSLHIKDAEKLGHLIKI